MRRVLLLKTAARLHLPPSPASFSKVESCFTLLCLLTFRALLHLPTAHANISTVLSPANSVRGFTCQVLLSICRVAFRLPTSPASFASTAAGKSRRLLENDSTCQLLLPTCQIILPTLRVLLHHPKTQAIVSFVETLWRRASASLSAANPPRESCLSKRSRSGAVRVRLERGDPSAEIVGVEALSPALRV